MTEPDIEKDIYSRELYGLRSNIFEMNYLRGYYGQLIGATVVGIKMNVEEDQEHGDPLFTQVWPLIIFEKDGQRYRCEISRDEEGNGPGYMFGLNQTSNSPEFMEQVNSLTKSDLETLIRKLSQEVDEDPWSNKNSVITWKGE